MIPSMGTNASTDTARDKPTSTAAGPATARQQQIAFRSDLVLTLFAHLLAFSL
jgi:hypothetical protein